MSVDVWNALWAGAVGAGVMLVMMYASRLLGLVRADFPRYQGCIITRQEKGAGTLLAGLAFHLVMGAVLATGYAVIFSLLGRDEWWVGMGIAFVHWLAAGSALPAMDGMNPCVRAGHIQPFGAFGRNYGGMMIIGFLMGHLVYGALVGLLYDAS